MARITYEDASITEYDNGTEEVRFTESEWEVMMSDPAFGYVCSNGHPLTDSDRRFIEIEGICPACLGEAESQGYDDEYEPDEPGNAADRAADREYDRFSDRDPF